MGRKEFVKYLVICIGEIEVENESKFNCWFYLDDICIFSELLYSLVVVESRI